MDGLSRANHRFEKGRLAIKAFFKWWAALIGRQRWQRSRRHGSLSLLPSRWQNSPRGSTKAVHHETQKLSARSLDPETATLSTRVHHLALPLRPWDSWPDEEPKLAELKGGA